MNFLLWGLSCAQLAPLEPRDKMLLGAWKDTAPGKDRPVAINERLGKKLSFFQLAQNLPLNFNDPPPVQLIDETNTNAMLYLTVYAIPGGLDSITDKAIDDFVKQIAGFTKAGRSVFIRLMPEMNGSWFIFGQKPVQFKRVWRRVVTAMRADPLTRGKVAFVWGPNPGFGYPFPGQQYSMNATSGEEFRELDTNRDGRLDGNDDPYSPYYPGDDVVDWVGLSTYYFGRTYPWIRNELPQPTKFADILSGVNGNGNVDFYQVYANQKNKPFMVAESGVGFHRNFIANRTAILDPGPGELAIKQAFWRQFITKPDIRTDYPRLKAICLFEFEKDEELTLRDFQVTSPAVIEAFRADLNAVQNNFVFAESVSKNSADLHSPKYLSGMIFGLALLFFAF